MQRNGHRNLLIKESWGCEDKLIIIHRLVDKDDYGEFLKHMAYASGWSRNDSDIWCQSMCAQGVAHAEATSDYLDGFSGIYGKMVSARRRAIRLVESVHPFWMVAFQTYRYLPTIGVVFPTGEYNHSIKGIRVWAIPGSTAK